MTSERRVSDRGNSKCKGQSMLGVFVEQLGGQSSWNGVRETVRGSEGGIVGVKFYSELYHWSIFDSNNQNLTSIKNHSDSHTERLVSRGPGRKQGAQLEAVLKIQTRDNADLGQELLAGSVRGSLILDKFLR